MVSLQEAVGKRAETLVDLEVKPVEATRVLLHEDVVLGGGGGRAFPVQVVFHGVEPVLFGNR